MGLRQEAKNQALLMLVLENKETIRALVVLQGYKKIKNERDKIYVRR